MFMIKTYSVQSMQVSIDYVFDIKDDPSNAKHYIEKLE